MQIHPIIAAVLSVLLLLGTTTAAAAQQYPTRPVRLVVPFPPGSPSDLLGRIVAERLSNTLRQPVVLDNRAGAAGTVGVEIGAKAPPDGHTLLIASTGALSISPALNPKLPYDPVKDLAPISLIASSPFLFAVGPSVPANTFQEFVTLAKAKPRQLNYASTGNGSATHLAIEQLKRLTGFDLTHVAYKGGGPGLIALMSGEVQVMFTSVPVLLAAAKSGKIKALAVSSASRSALLPDVPTISESGVPGYTMGFSIGILAPARTPAPLIGRLNKELVAMVAVPDVKERFLSQGAEPIGSSPEQFAAYIVSELRRYTKIIKDSGIRPE